MNERPTPPQIVNSYLDAFYAGDLAAARAHLAAAFTFEGPFVRAADRDAFLTSAGALAKIVRGHTRVKQWCDADDVATIYDVRIESPAGRGVVRMFDWSGVRDGVLVASRLLFDSAALRALLPARE